MKPRAWTSTFGRPPRGQCCRRCGASAHLVTDDGPVVCRVCLFAWGHLSASIARGSVIPELGGLQLRHASHEVPALGCVLCRSAQLTSTPTFDAWLRGRGG